MEPITNDLAGKAVSGGALTALGAIAGAVIQAWVARRKDSDQLSEKRSETALGAINEGSKQLMDTLLQSVKLLDEQLKATRVELRTAIAETGECQEKHREAERRIEDLEREMGKLIATKQHGD